MQPVHIPIINNSPHPLPEYATKGASGMDIKAWLEVGNITIEPFERILIPTGLFLEIPEGYEAQLRPRSGLALKQGITLLNTPGTIDSDYRGELKVLLINLSPEPQTIHDGDRIAQMVIASYETARWTPAAALEQSDRGAGGFGSTGN